MKKKMGGTNSAMVLSDDEEKVISGGFYCENCGNNVWRITATDNDEKKYFMHKFKRNIINIDTKNFKRGLNGVLSGLRDEVTEYNNAHKY